MIKSADLNIGMHLNFRGSGIKFLEYMLGKVPDHMMVTSFIREMEIIRLFSIYVRSVYISSDQEFLYFS